MTAMYRQDFVRMAVHAAVFSQDWETERLLAKEPQATVWLLLPYFSYDIFSIDWFILNHTLCLQFTRSD